MKNPLAEIYYGLKSLFVGMAITLREFFKPIVTVQYPHQTLKIPARFRGHIELVSDPGTGKAKCFVCKLCERACPSDCITVEGIKPEGAKRKTVTTYRLDFTKCSLCGSCVEACRDGAIRFSREYNLASTSKEEFIMDLFKRLEAQRLEADQTETGSAGGSDALAKDVPTAPANAEPSKPAPAQAEPPKPVSHRLATLPVEAK